MNIYPDFYKQFTCIGNDCLETCCGGWGIDLDQETLDYYNKLEDDFGPFIRQNFIQNKGMTCIKLNDQKRCPFLDEEGLCRIYIEYGESHMSDTCQLFPRRLLEKGENTIRCFSLSCEEVLYTLYNKPDPIRCQADGNLNVVTTDDLMVYELSQFIAWGIELLQNTSIPLSVCLGTVIYVGMAAEESFKKKDYESFEAAILQAPEILAQFQQSKEELSKDSLAETAWSLIFCIVDTFCTIMNEADSYKKESFLWETEIFAMDDNKRKEYLIACHEKREKTPRHDIFMRRLASISFFSHSMALEVESGEALYLQDLCNYLILAEILPLTWNLPPDADIKQYLSRLSYISRKFEQSSLVKKYVYPIIQDLFSPDLFTYVMAFMVLLDD